MEGASKFLPEVRGRAVRISMGVGYQNSSVGEFCHRSIKNRLDQAASLHE
jgi:hypothetical protein